MGILDLSDFDNETMDKKQSDILIFLDYWDNDNPTSDVQMGFMFAQMDNEEESEDIGEVYSNEFFYKKNPKEAIKEEIGLKPKLRCMDFQESVKFVS